MKEKLIFLKENGALIIQAHPFREANYIDHIRLFPRQVDGVEVMEVTRPFFNELSGNFFRDGEAEDVFNLRGKDYHGDAGGEPCGDREWNKADERPHAAEPKDDEEEARHQCADQQAGCVVLLQDAHDDDHEGSGGAAYLIFASAEQ